ncbi:MAG: hypothetical protein K2X09_02410 [Rickettsiales bacterium]|nr:hypothetical protein [Rickettsiales bacterium]
MGGYVVGAIGMLSILPALIPGVGTLVSAGIQTPLLAASHIVDRFRNGSEANDELQYRAQYYSAQIFKTLGVRAAESRKATVAEFKAAANINPEMAKLYAAPIKKKDKENASSAALNGGVWGVGLVTPGGAEAIKGLAEAGKIGKIAAGGLQAANALIPMVAVTMGSGALVNALKGEIVDPQEYLEAIHKTVAEAKSKGMNVREVLTPQMVFLLRVSQDPKFAESIKHDYKKSFHKMNQAEQTQVMQAYPALANAATSEAYAVANDMLPVQELGAMKPNLNGTANAYAVGTRNSSFADRVTARRAALAPSPAGGIA